MKISSVKKVIHEVAQINLPLAATVVEVVDQLERRHNIAHGLFNINTATGKTWKEIFDEMSDFVYNETSESYYVEDPVEYEAKNRKRKKKLNKSKQQLLEDELDRLDLAKTITEEELERRKKAALEREREARKEAKGYTGPIPSIVVPTIMEEDEE